MYSDDELLKIPRLMLSADDRDRSDRLSEKRLQESEIAIARNEGAIDMLRKTARYQLLADPEPLRIQAWLETDDHGIGFDDDFTNLPQGWPEGLTAEDAVDHYIEKSFATPSAPAATPPEASTSVTEFRKSLGE